MKNFNEWDKKEYPLPPCYERGSVGRETLKQRKRAWKAALEWLKSTQLRPEIAPWTTIEEELNE